MNAQTRRLLASLLIVALAAPVFPARAELNGDRARIASVLARHLDVEQVSARVAALTDEEAALVAAEMETLPAGGNPVVGLGGALAVFAYVVALTLGLVVSNIVTRAKRAAP